MSNNKKKAKNKARAEQKKFRFSRATEIGSPDAETDKLLMRAFISNDALDSLLDIDNQKSIIIGRTGSGKTALLQYLEKTQDKVSRIEPEAMSLRFLSNSTILKYFRELGINLNFFYKVLWKHVFIVELLKLYFGDDIFKKQNWFDSISQSLFGGKKNPKRERAIDYLRRWSKDFWIDTEKRVKEIEKTVETRFLQETGKRLTEILGGLKAEDNVKEVSLTEYRHKAETIINEIQAEEIFEIINIMKSDLYNGQRKDYIIIDDLDKEWIPTEIRYDLISAMVEVVKEFQVFKGAKIVIALRDNLHQIIFSGIKHKGGQREKFKPLYLHLDWNRYQLEKLIDKRLELLTENFLTIRNAFQKYYSEKGTGFDYILDRTFLRPRDVISYLNHAIENANNKSFFTLDLIKKAEIYYSIDRLQAIEDEWGENYGEIKDLYSFLVGRNIGFKIDELKEENFIKLLASDSPEQRYNGELLTLINRFRKDGKFKLIVKDLIYLLYQMGIVGLKKGPEFEIGFYYNRENPILPDDLTFNTKVYVHKAFYSVLKTNVKELE
jgi:uncharacterized protein YeeX (DUF496 family)